jgi:hypothetical protein
MAELTRACRELGLPREPYWPALRFRYLGLERPEWIAAIAAQFKAPVL